MFEKWGDRLTLRFYGHHNDVFDARVVLQFPQVRSLIINCIYDDIENPDALSELKHLTHLSLGIYGLKNKKILDCLPLENLVEFSLEETETKAVDLAPLARAIQLKTLKLYGHKKNIDTVSNLSNLEEFVFNAAKNVSIDFINELSSLKSLKFVLGGKESIEEINHLPKLEELAFTMMRGLNNIGDLQRFPSLVSLFMQDQAQMEAVKLGVENKSLRHLWFHNCPKLSNLKGLSELQALCSAHLSKTGMKLEDMKFPQNLTHLYLHSDQLKKENAERSAIDALGFIPKNHDEMPFFYK